MKTIDSANEIITALAGFTEPLDGLSGDQLQAEIDKYNAAEKQRIAAKAIVISAANDKQTALKELNALITRVRSSTRGKYGPDSTQYEQVGGTRASERKARKKKSA